MTTRDLPENQLRLEESPGYCSSKGIVTSPSGGGDIIGDPCPGCDRCVARQAKAVHELRAALVEIKGRLDLLSHGDIERIARNVLARYPEGDQPGGTTP